MRTTNTNKCPLRACALGDSLDIYPRIIQSYLHLPHELHTYAYYYSYFIEEATRRTFLFFLFFCLF